MNTVEQKRWRETEQDRHSPTNQHFWWVSDSHCEEIFIRFSFGFTMSFRSDGRQKDIPTFLSLNGRKPECLSSSGLLHYSSSSPARRRLRAYAQPHVHTDKHFAQQGWGGPLLHACSERRHPSRDQRTPVNPLLKILANPLGLLRVASGHCVCHKSGIRQWKAVNGASTPDPLSRHVCSEGKGAYNCAAWADLHHMLHWTLFVFLKKVKRKRAAKPLSKCLILWRK